MIRHRKTCSSCATCPLAHLETAHGPGGKLLSIPACVLEGRDLGAPGEAYPTRAPMWCPLRAGAVMVELRLPRSELET